MFNKYLLLMIFLIFSIMIIQPQANAAEISVGATSWYSWWDFDNKDDNSEDQTMGPELLYGPAMSLKFTDDFSLTFVFLYGKFYMEHEEEYVKMRDEIKRLDGDLALNYRLGNFFKIFAGGKYMAYKMSGDMDHTGYGPGAGISAVIPLIWNIYLLGNISGLYLWGTEHPSDNNTEAKGNLKYHEYGYNSSLSLAYYIAPAAVTLSLGGRYQHFLTNYNDSVTSDLRHKFYGITAAATYSFSL